MENSPPNFTSVSLLDTFCLFLCLCLSISLSLALHSVILFLFLYLLPTKSFYSSHIIVCLCVSSIFHGFLSVSKFLLFFPFPLSLALYLPSFTSSPSSYILLCIYLNIYTTFLRAVGRTDFK